MAHLQRTLNGSVGATEELLQLVQETVTLDGRVPVYREANISLVTVSPWDLYPSAKYVIAGKIGNIIKIRRMLLPETDIFKLTGIYRDGDFVISPPIVEVVDGVPTIIDGLHRCSLALQMGENINVVMVEDVDSDIPIISLPVGWWHVNVYSRRPESPYLLRNLREGIVDEPWCLRKHYRDYSTLGSNGRRPTSVQAG